MNRKDKVVRLIRDLSGSNEARERFLADPIGFSAEYDLALDTGEISRITDSLASTSLEDLDERLSKSICLW